MSEPISEGDYVRVVYVLPTISYRDKAKSSLIGKVCRIAAVSQGCMYRGHYFSVYENGTHGFLAEKKGTYKVFDYNFHRDELERVEQSSSSTADVFMTVPCELYGRVAGGSSQVVRIDSIRKPTLTVKDETGAIVIVSHLLSAEEAEQQKKINAAAEKRARLDELVKQREKLFAKAKSTCDELTAVSEKIAALSNE